MLRTFKETITSLQDKAYGSTIIKLPFTKVLWYWSKYFIWVSVITAILAVGIATYFVPQLPRLLRQHLPDATFSVTGGQLSTSLKQPAVLGPLDLPIIIDTFATNSAALDSRTTGILFLKDQVIFKQDTGSVSTQSLKDFPDFSFEKNSIVSWISAHQTGLWFGALLGIILLSLIFSILFWIGRMIGFAVWSLVFWIAAKIIKREITYTQSFKLVLYASVLPYLLGSLFILAPNQLLSLLSLAVFIYFGGSWLLNLPKK